MEERMKAEARRRVMKDLSRVKQKKSGLPDGQQRLPTEKTAKLTRRGKREMLLSIEDGGAGRSMVEGLAGGG
jgi:hypothetical protein